MRLLYVAVALISAFMGYVALEAKPIESNNLSKAVRHVIQARDVITRQTDYSESEVTQPHIQACCSQKSCCPGPSACSSASCRTGKSTCRGNACTCG